MLVTNNIKLESRLVRGNKNMDNERITEALERSNKWWKGAFELDYKQREAYPEIQRFIPKRQIIALVGLRRTGKSTIMFKIIKDELESMEREHIAYFSFDEFKSIRLRDVIKCYERIMKKDTAKGKFLFLFDEIQKIENWEEQLKRLYDENANIKFIISGSESLFIRKKSKESLAGRMYEFHIRTLSFNEYLKFKGKNFANIRLYKEEILREFHSFLACNGFPETIDENQDVSGKYVKENVIDRIIYKDIPQIVPVSDPAILDHALKIILNDPGQIINMNELAKELGIARQTASLYINYLEKSYLIRKLYNYSKNARKTQRRSKKYYPTIISSDIIDNKEMFGKVFETALVNQLNAEFFWRSTAKNEVDIIQLEPLMAIEIKSGNIREKDLVPLQRFKKKFKPEKAIIISYDTEMEIGNIKIIPFYSYLLEKP